MDPELVDAEYTTDFPEEAYELLAMAPARRPWARVTICVNRGFANQALGNARDAGRDFEMARELDIGLAAGQN